VDESDIAVLFTTNINIMKTTVKTRGSKATIVAAALIMALSIAVFGTFADESESTADNEDRPAHHQKLTEGEREIVREARELFKAGDKETAKAMLEDAGIERPRVKRAYRRAKWFNKLTEGEREIVREARELFKAGDKETAKAMLEDAGIERPRVKRGHHGEGRDS